MSGTNDALRVLVASTLLGAAGHYPLTAQQSPPVLRASVELVTIDVQVTPAKNAPLRWLTAAEFDIRVSGQKRPPASVTFLHHDEGTVIRNPGLSSPQTAKHAGCTFGLHRKVNRPTAHYVIGVDRTEADQRDVKDVKVQVVDKAFTVQTYVWRSPVRSSVLLPFSCEVFSPNASAAKLASRFGAENVKTAQVPWGGAEGDFSEGTVLFDGSADARLEIYWRDTANKREPEWVSVRAKSTRWQSTAGIKVGTTLRALEQLNGNPFRLVGFGNDVSGTVMSCGRADA